MPPKRGRGRGRGRGAFPEREEQDASVGQQRSYRDEPRRDYRGRGTFPQREQGASFEQQRPYRDEPRRDYGAPSRREEDASDGHQRPNRFQSRSNRRGRGAFPKRKEQDASVGQQRPYSDEPRQSGGYSAREPQDLVATYAPVEEVKYHEPGPSASAASKKDKRKTRTVHPEELGIELEQKARITSAQTSRPGVGTLGKRIKLISNHFPIKVPSGNVYHYDVEITKKNINFGTGERVSDSNKSEKKYRCLNTRNNRKVVELMLKTNRNFHGLYAAYDGRKNLYTRKKLNATFPLKCEVVLPDESGGNGQEVFVVEIEPVKKDQFGSFVIDLNLLHEFYHKRTSSVPRETIMALETILRHGPCLRFTPVFRSFFYSPDPRNLHPLGGGLEIWYGYHQGVTLGQWAPTVVINTTASTFWQEGPVLDYIAELLNTRVHELQRRPCLSDGEIRRLSKKLSGRKIKVTHLSYKPTKCIFKLTRLSASKLKLDDNSTSIEQYFRERYGTVLKFPNLPCLHVKPDKKKNYFPIEVCYFIPGEHARTELTPDQRKKFIDFTCISPREKFHEIDDIVHRADFNNDACVREFGVNVSSEPLRLEGRVLDPPSLLYKDGNEIYPADGSWNLRKTRFLEEARIKQWVLLSFARLHNDYLDNFISLLLQMGKDLGIDIRQPVRVHRNLNDRCDMEKILSDVRREAELAIVILPIMDESRIYGKIKRVSEILIGLTTQCIKQNTVRNLKDKRGGLQVVCNLWLKINSKMGGQNYSVMSLVEGEIPGVCWKPVIIIGADVNHPPPSAEGKPSLAACVGSLNANSSRFAVSVRAQMNEKESKRTVETILDLENMVRELLEAFYRNTRGKRPEKIIFYRDGVSDGQIDDVRKREVTAVRKACRSIQKDYEPAITFIIVQKRHHTRFMNSNPRQAVGRAGNIPPGTTVDTAVTHPENFDFFLCSHMGLKGVSRPSHYTVVEDDNNFTADELQTLTFQLCHLNVRCTKSVSIPAPVAYADLVAYRARRHLDAKFSFEDEGGSSCTDASSFSSTVEKVIMGDIEIKDELKSSMYFV